MNTLSNYAQFQKSPNTTNSSMNTQPMNQQDMLARLLQQEEEAAKHRALILKAMQQQAATPVVAAKPAAAPVDTVKVVAAKAKAANAKITDDMKKAFIASLIALRDKSKTEADFLKEALKQSSFTQIIIAGARGKKDVSSRTEGLKLLWKDAHPVAPTPPPNKGKRTTTKKTKRKARDQKWENLGGYYAVDDDMIKDRCHKATTAGIGVAKKAFAIAELPLVQDLVKMARASTVRADAGVTELNKAGDKFSKDPAMAKYQGKYFQLILDFPNISNRAYGWKIMLRLYAPGCPPLEDKGISKKNKKAKKPASPPNMYDAVKNRKRAAATVARSEGTIGSNVSRVPRDTPMVVMAPEEATQPAAKKQKVDDAVGSPTTVKEVKDITPYRRQLLIKALQHCQLPDAQYSAVKWYARYGTMLGCTKAKFHRHIDVRLKAQGFKWENWGQGKGKWCLDHMKPIRNFMQSLEDEVERCWHYTNIMPEDWEYNVWKGDKDIWRMYWSLDRWLIHGRNESFVGEEQHWRDKGMARGAWLAQDGIKDQEKRDKNKIVFN